MRNQTVFFFAVLLLTLLAGCKNDDITPTGEVIYNHVSMMGDETNMFEVIGFADYVFVGAGLREVGKKYIFIGYGQPDGSLLLEYLSGNIEYSDDLRIDYIDFIENQIPYQRERFISRYDITLGSV